MGSRNLYLKSFKFESRGIFWLESKLYVTHPASFGNISQNFESFRPDADRRMRKDTSKYVGDAFKKVYTEIMHEFPSSSSLRPEKRSNKVKCFDEIANRNGEVNDGSYSSVSVEEEKVYEPVEVEEPEETVKSSDDTSGSDSVVNNWSCNRLFSLEEKLDSEYKPSSETPTLNASINKNARKGNFEFSCRAVDVDSEEEEDELTEGKGSSDVGFEVSNEETEMPFNLSISGYFDERSNLMSPGKVEKVNLGQSCILVEETEDPPILPLQNKHKSYKKTIRDVFLRRSWSKGKQTEEQFAVLYKQDSTKNTTAMSSLREGVRIDSRSSDSLDSDWELV